MKKGILVFDLCSSTEIVESLSNTQSMDQYVSLMLCFDNLLDRLSKYFGYRKYKFLGDGFILVINEDIPVADIIYLSTIINKVGNNLIKEFLDDVIPFTPKRTGLTF